MTEASARVDTHGRLVSAEPRLAALNEQAGGTLEAPLALPSLATIARLAQRLGIVVARPATVADGEDDLELWVRAEPDGEGVLLQVSGWRTREPLRQPAGGAADAALDEADADFLWETDAAMMLTLLAPAGADTVAPLPMMLGEPLTRLLVFEGVEGILPLVTAAAGRGGFDDEKAIVRENGRVVRVSARARLDADGRFAGFRGTGRFVATAPPPTGFDDAFGARLEKALRSPLARIVAHADSIGAQIDGPLKREYVEYAHDIAGAARHLIGLVEDLVDLQAIERADFTIAPEPIDLTDVACRAAGLLAVRAGNAEVTIVRPEGALAASGDFRRALQILVNLIGNAVRYSPRGGSVDVAVAGGDGTAAVTVTDAGKGIAPADQQRIFDKFGRVDPGEPGGTGLGLYIARRLARAMGGDVTVVSTPGEGARFTLTLPGA